MLLSPRRIIGEDGQPLRLNTIPELDENCSFEGSTTQARANYLNGSMKALTDEYESLRSSFNEMKTLLEATTRQKQALLMQVSSYRLILERKDSYFKKVIDYVRIELQHDRSRYELIIHGLQQQLDAVKQHSLNTTGKPKLSIMSDEDTPIQSRMNSRTNSTFLWDLQELFLKYMNEDNRFKGILFPVMRKLVELPSTQDILELCGRVFDEVSQYEKQLKRTQILGNLVDDFLLGTNNIFSEEESMEEGPKR